MPLPAGAVSRLSPMWTGRAGYLDTAAYGLPPTTAVTALRTWVGEWASGVASLGDWLPATDEARHLFAGLAGVDAHTVATGTSASQLIGIIASSVPEGSRVLVPDGEFTSLLYPFLAQSDRRVAVRSVPRSRLVDGIDATTDVVAFSAVSSFDGNVLPLTDIADAAHRAGALTVVDAAQACGWHDADWGRFDAVVVPAFKWLTCPRGVAFLAVSRRLLDKLRPSSAGWFASDQRQHYFGGPLVLAGDASRLDTAPVWSSWGAARESLRVLMDLGVPAIGHHNTGLANRLRAGLGRPPQASAIVLAGGDGAVAALRRAGIVCSPRPGGARLSFHVYNTAADVDRALDALATDDGEGKSDA